MLPAWKLPSAFVLACVVALVTDRLVPEWSSLAIALAFLYLPFLAVRSGPSPFDRYGLVLAHWRRALAVAGLTALVVFPLFAWGAHAAWHLLLGWRWEPAAARLGDASFWASFAATQVLMVALPEEFFFRGFLQGELDSRWPARFRFLGASVGPGLFAAAALFALGHLATQPSPTRLLVFFPGLLFGWLKARTGTLLAPIAFHAASNLLMELLIRCHAS
jgi:membrane protease YdiL (CAAX protease family)